MPPLPDRLRAIPELLQAACPDRRFVYVSEWLGYLPFGLHHGVDAGGRRIELPADWSRDDLDALVALGRATVVGRETGPVDGEERVIYLLSD